jgi:hypothetical protein
MMMYQHGIGYSKYGFTRALPYEGFIGVMQTASEIFINKQLNEDTLAVIFDKLVEPGNKVFKNLLVTPKQYLAPEPSVVKEEDEFMSEEEAAAMLEKMGIKPIGEELTQPSTSVNPLVKAGVKSTDMYGNAAKDIQMADESTQFIGFGTIMKEGNISSTDKYAKAWGNKANTGIYTAGDTIMVSGSGNFGRGGVDKTEEANAIKKTLTENYKPLLDKAIAAGASFRIGNQYSKGNLSDQLVADYLQKKGYTEEKLNGYSRWTSLIKATQPSTSVKEGVQELFDSNPELADQVYEALEFQNKQKLENLKKEFSSFSNIRDKFKGDLKNVKNLVSSLTQMSADANFYKPFATDISEQRKKEIISGNATSYIFEDNFDDYRKTIKKSLDDELKSEADRFNYWFERGDTFYYFDTENKKYYSVTSSMKNEDGIEITKKEYYDALDDHKDALEKKNLQDQEDVKENVLRQPFLEGRTIRLFDNHFVIVTKHVIKEKGDLFINEIEFMYYDEFNYDRLKELEKQKITPLQKQQAQQKFQEYVDATGKQDIEGFKKFVTQSPKNNLNAPDGLPGIPRTSTDCQ